MDKTFEERIKKLIAGVDDLLNKISDKHEDYFNGQAVGLNYVKELIDNTFPEFAESEDERIRKWLIDYFAKIGKSWIHCEFTCEQIVSYLEKQKDIEDRWIEDREQCFWNGVEEGKKLSEKQKEQKPKTIVRIPKFRVGDIIQHVPLEKWDSTKKITSIYENGYNYNLSHLGDTVSGGVIGFALEDEYELVEQKPAEIDEDIELGLDRALQIIKEAKGVLEGYQSDDGIYECDHAIRTLTHILKNGIEQKPAESEEKFESIDNAFRRGREVGFREGVDSVKPAEWSGEDIDKMVNVRARKSGTTKSETEFYRQGIKDTLKSLRPRPKEELAKMLQDEYNKGKEIGEKEGYTKGYNKGYKDANESVPYHFPVMPITPFGWGCDGTHCINPQMDCINCPRRDGGGTYITSPNSASGESKLEAHWRPSEEQLEWLETAKKIAKEHELNAYHIIESLYNDLKKLI